MPDAQQGTEVVEHELRVAAPPEVVFPYFTDPEKMVRWMGIEATLDPRPGGVSRIVVNPEAVMAGEYVEVVPHTKVVFTWGWERNGLLTLPPASTVVEVSLTPEEDGTLVRLVHRQLPEEVAEFHRIGWGYYLPRLATVAAGGDPGPDPAADPAVAARSMRAAIRS
jgi:uncharacterized protein YndB with AHSA1/START domain